MTFSFPRLSSAGVSFLCVIFSCQPHDAGAAIAQSPLFLTARVDPNVMLSLSVEEPMGGAAYADQPGNPSGCSNRTKESTDADDPGIGTCYFKTTEYLGYFDPNKCYTYDGTKFVPDGATNAAHECKGKWSGNFLNWATMTAIDEYIWTMTGGNRIVDTTAETVIKRARAADWVGWFPIKKITKSLNTEPNKVTPFSDSTIYINNTDDPFKLTIGTSFDPNAWWTTGSERGTFNVQVKVCDPAQGLESNCKAYTDGSGNTYYKPEGLIQQKADHMRFAVTSYTLDNKKNRHGGVLRSNMKYVGPAMPDGSGGTTANANKEFGTDGLLVNNPDGASGGLNSGIINYINQFSEAGYKQGDPVSELFYENIRYFKNLGPTPEYSSGLSSGEYGGFQIVNSWQDPIQHRCQKNFIIGINDAYPWLDKKLPGTCFTSDTITGRGGASMSLAVDSSGEAEDDFGEPSNPDPDIDVCSLTNTVGNLEGMNTTWREGDPWSSGTANGTTNAILGQIGNFDLDCHTDESITALGEVLAACDVVYSDDWERKNSYYIAGLAYYANTQDIRSDYPGKQTITSFVIDTQEYNPNPLDGPQNMLWLAGKYGGFVDKNNNQKPDLQEEWDANNDGIPDNYVFASQPEKLVDALQRSFAEIESRTSTAAAVAASSTRLNSGSKVFQARFDTEDWSGGLLQFSIDTTTGALSTTPAWDAADLIPTPSGRNLLTYDPTKTSAAKGTTFTWKELNGNQQTALVDKDHLNYLRGDASKERRNGGSFRDRSKRLGDIIHSAPWYVGTQNQGYHRLPGSEGSDYLSFRQSSAYAGRSKMLYVGANDGMLHGFDATTGIEKFAYLPNATILDDLKNLADPNYSHRYYVDGSPKAGDAYIGGNWKTLLAGTTGRGGKAVFVLDVTDPDNMTAANVLWEISTVSAFDNVDLTGDTDGDPATIEQPGFAPDLGFTLPQPSIVRMADGHWAVIVANGYLSSRGKAVLFILDAATGDILRIFDTGVGSSADPNGLSTPIAIDNDGDAVVDAIYAGDLKGNLWKFDVDDTDKTQWKVDKLFTATAPDGTAQPITAKPEVGLHPDGGVLVFFGTGKYFEDNDDVVGTTPQTQTFYAVWDEGKTTVTTMSRANLQAKTILSEVTNPTLPDGSTSPFAVRMTGDNCSTTCFDKSVDYSGKKGWFLDLVSPVNGAEGERVIHKPQLRDGRIIFVTLIPSQDPCDFGGSGWLMEMNGVTGQRLGPKSPFDISGDNSIDGNDRTKLPDNTLATVSGLKPNVGIPQAPTIVKDQGKDKEYKYIAGSSGKTAKITEPASFGKKRLSWRQLR